MLQQLDFSLYVNSFSVFLYFFFFNDTATTEIYTLSLHDALPIYLFNIDDVIDAIIQKLIRRHPHIFGDSKVENSKDVAKNWEQIKLEEGRESVLEGVPKHLPELQRAYRIQEKVSKVGFDWKNKKDVWAKVEEEIKELKKAETINNTDEIENEIGDLIFSLVNYSRFLGVNPENALRKTNNKFTKRFIYIENKLLHIGRKITESNLEEMDKYWNESKAED